MPDESIGPEVKELIERHVNSVGHLEALAFMYQHRDQAWTPDQLSEELRTNISYAQLQLRELVASGLLEKHQNAITTYKYASKNPNVDRAIESLIELYRTSRVAIIDAIYARSMDNVKSFADAFILKKD